MGGLPATGKTSICREVVRRISAVHVRVDTIEQALVDTGLAEHPVGPAGYIVAYALAREQLVQGHVVLAESVNPLTLTRTAWRAVAAAAAVPALEVEVVCTDVVEHRRRAETRRTDVRGLRVPAWQEIIEREYEPWTSEHVVIDTGSTTLDQAVTELVGRITELSEPANVGQPMARPE